MSILEKRVWVLLNNNHNYYKELGYTIPTSESSKGKFKAIRGAKILVDVFHLPKSSNIELTKICDECDKVIKNTPYFAIVKQRKNNNGKDVCKACSIRSREITKAKTNPLAAIYEDLVKEWVKCLETGCSNYSPDMVSVKSNYYVLWSCSKDDCDCQWEAKISDRTNGSGCPACWGRIVSDKNRLSLFFPELNKEWNYFRNGSLTPNDFTYSSHKRVWWICEHKHEWETPVYSRTITKANCPICSESKGEKRIREWLESNNISFTPQQIYPNLNGVGGKPLSYDFYLNKQNILIEYQGEFHDGSGNNDYTKLNIKTQQEHDKRKRDYSKENDIDLLEIWYWDFENIEKILTMKLLNKEYDNC
jgi:hypothetical protein